MTIFCGMPSRLPLNFTDAFHWWTTLTKGKSLLQKCRRQVFHLTTWSIWSARNKLRHEHGIKVDILENTLTRCAEYFLALEGDNYTIQSIKHWLVTGIWVDESPLQNSVISIQIATWRKGNHTGLAALMRLPDGQLPIAIVKWSVSPISWGESWLLEYCLQEVAELPVPISLRANNKTWLKWVTAKYKRSTRLLDGYQLLKDRQHSIRPSSKNPLPCVLALFFLAPIDGYYVWKDLSPNFVSTASLNAP